jgi:hypothetical protein
MPQGSTPIRALAAASIVFTLAGCVTCREQPAVCAWGAAVMLAAGYEASRRDHRGSLSQPPRRPICSAGPC